MASFVVLQSALKICILITQFEVVQFKEAHGAGLYIGLNLDSLGQEIDTEVDEVVEVDGSGEWDVLDDDVHAGFPHRCEADPTKFSCTASGKTVCLSKEYQCDGRFNCDDGSDEDPPSCDFCKRPGLAMCRDRSRCVRTSSLCSGSVTCSDGSDESDTHSQCKFCSEEGSLPCPGFPGNCGSPCNGRPTCPDHWNVLLSTCKSKLYPSEDDALVCSKEQGLSPCRDGSKCINTTRHLCNSYKGCADGSDENSDACAEKCDSLANDGHHLHHCDNGSCIRLNLACSAQKRPLCNDFSDMDYELCKGKCYFRFPGIEDPYRLPCANGTKRCILKVFHCDGDPDCDDGTKFTFSSDERHCPLVTYVGLSQTLLLCLAVVAFSWIIFFAIFACTMHCTPSLDEEKSSIPRSEQTSTPQPLPDQPIPSFLLHPALSDMDNQSWNWQEVGEQLNLETVFFNRDPQALIDFLHHIAAQEAHPDNLHSAFQGFYVYMTSKGYDCVAVAKSLRQAIGHHYLAHLALKGRPNWINKKVFEIGKWLSELETKGKVYSFILIAFRAFKTSITPFILNLDYVKDLVLYLILQETILRMEEDNLAASATELDLIVALLFIFCVSIILTSINSYFLRKRFFKTNFWLSLVLGLLSPLLPAVYHIQLSHLTRQYKKEKSKLSKYALKKKIKNIETLANSLQQTKEIEVGLEAVIQILLLLGFISFYPYVFKAPSGQTYSYFYGVARLVLKGNKELFFASLAVSLIGPCWFYTERTNVLRHGSLNISRKIVLMTRNVLFLLVRLFAIASAIFLPVIKSWDMFIGNQGVDATSLLDNINFRLEFQKYFKDNLEISTSHIRKNAQFFGLFILAHIMLVASHALCYSPKFGKSMMRERVIHLLSSFWLPLPFFSIRGVDKGKEKAQLWFLVGLHSMENFLILLTSRLVYQQESYLHIFVVFDSVLVFFNLLGVLVSVFYVSKMELYAGVPEDYTSTLPSFGPEVSWLHIYDDVFTITIIYHHCIYL